MRLACRSGRSDAGQWGDDAPQAANLVRGLAGVVQGIADAAHDADHFRDFIRDVWTHVKAGADAGRDLNAVYRETYAALQPKYGRWVIFDHCMPFDVTRAYDEATQYPDPRIWTAERDIEMWKTLEG